MIYLEEPGPPALRGSQLEASGMERLVSAEELDASRGFIVAEALEPARTAARVRIRNGELSVMDAPHVSTTEQLRGFLLIEARDLNDAIRMAARLPSARLGCVEVRPVHQLSADRASAPLPASTPASHSSIDS